MNAEILIKVDGVSKKFCRDLKKSLWYGMKDLGSELIGRSCGGKGELRPDEFWAVKDVSFELKRGECLGLIGHNGAGKSTLLKMLNGLIKPDQGKITMRGRIGALIELNAGFNPILTGRENVYIYGSILGITKKEIDEKYDSIVEYAEMGDFMDMSVQSYSSGMKVRLGFAVAVHMEPDVLLIDEVLSVGDISFKKKCMERIEEIRRKSCIIFISHNMYQVERVCNRALLIDRGEVINSGNIENVINTYYCLEIQAASNTKGINVIQATSDIMNVIIKTVDSNQINKKIYQTGENITFQLDIESAVNLKNAIIAIAIFNDEGIRIGNTKSIHNSDPKYSTIAIGNNLFDIELFNNQLLMGNYKALLKIKGSNNDVLFEAVCANFSIYPLKNHSNYDGIVKMDFKWALPNEGYLD